MRLDAFDYDLPRSLIAQRPAARRSASRLMVVNRETGAFEDSFFGELPRYVGAGDVVVVNRSRVVPARLFVRRATGGRIELLFTKRTGERRFQALAEPLRKLKPAEILYGDAEEFSLRAIARRGDREMEFEIASVHGVMELLEEHGHVPLPPYIERADQRIDRERYQTVFADEEGSVAAPTAGLHFDGAVLRALEEKGVEVCSVVLHVGLGTFLPLTKDELERNRLHSEPFSVEGGVLETIRAAKEHGGRVVAVGTTVTRVLETIHQRSLLGTVPRGETCRGETDLFIYPGYAFGIVDRLLTNFHLPRSSLFVLVCAFLGVERTRACYEHAIRESYRFYSYGDAMLIG